MSLFEIIEDLCVSQGYPLAEVVTLFSIFLMICIGLLGFIFSACWDCGKRVWQWLKKMYLVIADKVH